MDRSESVEFNKKFYRDGRRAFANGRSLQSNPWPDKTMAFKSWTAGWQDANEENWKASEINEEEN